MTAPQADPAVLISDALDVGDVPLAEDLAIGISELARIMRGISAIDGEPVAPVSAFNSSI